MKTSNLCMTLSVGLLFLAGAAMGQGDLTPPGPPAETMKTLEQVEPRIDVATLAGDADSLIVIDSPGSYYLSSNLSVTNANGILIQKVGVTLDLNGFEISGSGRHGIYIDGGADGATVRNGTVRGFEYGVYCHTSPAPARGCLVQELVVSGCSTYALFMGETARVLDCTAQANSGGGIYADTGSTIQRCTAQANQGTYGIYGGMGSVIIGCTAYENTSTYGIYGDAGSTISECSAHGNQATYGIYGGNGCTITGCAALGNEGVGAQSGGIRAGNGSLVVSCTSRQNTNTNNPSTSSQGRGISVPSAVTIKGCTVNQNRGDGIRVFSDCVVVGNLCSGNGAFTDGAGIRADFGDSRLEGNTVANNARGIEVESSGNFIVRNTAEGNGNNYVIAADNKVGVIVNAPNSLAISGSTGGAGVGSTDPWANFSF